MRRAATPAKTEPMRAITLDGDQTYVGPATIYRTPPEALDSLDALVGRLKPHLDTGATVIITERAAERLGLLQTVQNSAQHPALDTLRRDGWKVSGLTGWTTLWGPCRPTIHLGILPLIDMENFPLAVEGTELGELTWRLWHWHRWTGVPFHTTPGVSALDLMRELAAGARKAPRWVAPAGCPVPRNAEMPYVGWKREPLAGEALMPYRHQYDLVLMYLAAAGNADLPVDALTRTGPMMFDPAMGGYWQVEGGWWPEDARLPDPMNSTGRGLTWVTTPTMALLVELGHSPEVVDSWTAPTGRLLRDWSARVRDAIATAAAAKPDRDAELVHATLKLSYRQALGLLNSSGGRIYRPEWWHTVVAKARANLYRKLVAATKLPAPRYPLEIPNTDSVIYASEHEDPWTAAPDNFKVVPPGVQDPTELGTWKVEEIG